MFVTIKDDLDGKLSYRMAADKHHINASTLESWLKKIKHKLDEKK